MAGNDDDDIALTPPPSVPLRVRRAARVGAVVAVLSTAGACGDDDSEPPMVAPMVSFDGGLDGEVASPMVPPEDGGTVPPMVIEPDAGDGDATVAPMVPPEDGGA
jgi:hypothetical protein